jgi:hypothetical protein
MVRVPRQSTVIAGVGATVTWISRFTHCTEVEDG